MSLALAVLAIVVLAAAVWAMSTYDAERQIELLESDDVYLSDGHETYFFGEPGSFDDSDDDWDDHRSTTDASVGPAIEPTW